LEFVLLGALLQWGCGLVGKATARMHYGRFSKESQRWLKMDAEHPMSDAALPEDAWAAAKPVKRGFLPATEQAELPFSEVERPVLNTRRS